jgi:IS5 family transposase
MRIGVDAADQAQHIIDTTPANTNGIVSSDKLLHGEEKRVFGDAG